MSTPRRGPAVLAGTLAGVVLVLLFVTLAARAGPSGIIHGTGHDGVFHAPSQAPPSPPAPAPVGGHGRPERPAPTPWWVHLILLGLATIACALVLVAAFSAFGLLSRITRPRRASADDEEPEVDWLEDPVGAAERIRRGADLREQLLRTGPPGNAIIACWRRFEEQADEVGLAPRAWETPSEFTVRVLGALARDQDAVQRLERLYVEARFSRHEISEEHRERAIEALRRVHGSLLTAIAVEP
ncbi:MAG: hypothetical protein QOD37_2568 [Gaiellales bacterium]|nr:hypothetical protein [Gaiellales bacterium]